MALDGWEEPLLGTVRWGQVEAGKVLPVQSSQFLPLEPFPHRGGPVPDPVLTLPEAPGINHLESADAAPGALTRFVNGYFYRGTLLVRQHPILGPYRRPKPRGILRGWAFSYG